MSNLDVIWLKAVQVFPILEKKLTAAECNVDLIKEVTGELVELNIVENVYETIVFEMESTLRSKVVPEFWKYFEINNNESLDNEKGFYQFKYAVANLEKDYSQFQVIIKRLNYFLRLSGLNDHSEEAAKFDEMLKVELLAQLPANFVKIIYSFYNTSFKVFVNSHQMNLDDDMEYLEYPTCMGCGSPTDYCQCQTLVCAFNKTNQSLSSMNLLDRLAGFTLTNLIQDRITAHVQDQCKGIFDQSHIKSLEEWLNTIVINWLTRIFNKGSLKIADSDENIKKIIHDFKLKLKCYLYETYAIIIIEQFFTIIIDYPESQPAIDDLKICIEKIDLRLYLVKSLKHSLETRLLHPGVNTSDILTGYVASIKAIRHLDSTGVLLETITEPVKQYMRSRSDTVRCVVTALTEEGPTELVEELAKSELITEDPLNNNDELTNWKNWVPDPIDVNPKKQSTPSRSADIISMVVDIYGSKDLFVNEYRSLLADRLLHQLDFNPEKELRNLELLKLRFGELLLHNCEVMLKDIGDSKRINAHIHNDAAAAEVPYKISSLILSSQFWPAFKNEALELPQEIQKDFDKYTKSYEAYKGNRTLCWRPAIGRINIEIQLSNRTLDMTVTPVQAAIIYLFQNKTEWTLEDLCQELKVLPSILRKRIAFWQSHGLIKEPSTDVFVLVEEATGDDAEMQTQSQDCDDDENESAMASVSDQREEELQVFWSYIVGMLTNLDSLPLERIHQMLKMFASHAPGVEFSQEELKNFLQRKVREHELIFAGGVYQLPK